ELLYSTLNTPDPDSYWFRGQSNIDWVLSPSALRYDKQELRDKALGVVQDEFLRFSYNKLPNPPALSDRLAWAGLAQHFGLPTRFLDWTQNPAIALFFCVNENVDTDGAVYLMNPLDLNLKAVKS